MTETSSPEPGSHCALPALGPALSAKVLGIMNEMLWSSWRCHGNGALSGNTTVTVATAQELKVTPYPSPPPNSKMLCFPHNPLQVLERKEAEAKGLPETKLSRN